MRDLEVLAEEVSGCVRCPLSQSRTQVVFGVGDPDADLLLVGEAPGFHEDQQGIPFVGSAGQLLTTLIGEVGLARNEVYIANVLKCRPPGNRDPLPREIEACTPYLYRQVELIQPLVVMTLGNFATQCLLGRKVGISRVRGQLFPWRGGTLIPTFHPAAALRGGKGDLVADMRKDFALGRRTLDEARARQEHALAAAAHEQLDLF